MKRQKKKTAASRSSSHGAESAPSKTELESHPIPTNSFGPVPVSPAIILPPLGGNYQSGRPGGLTANGSLRQAENERVVCSYEPVVENLRMHLYDNICECQRQLGMIDGWTWALTLATDAELRCLDRLSDVSHGGRFNAFGSRYTEAERFVFTIQPELGGDRIAAAMFWKKFPLGGKEACDDAYIDGFTAGAVEVWNDLKESV